MLSGKSFQNLAAFKAKLWNMFKAVYEYDVYIGVKIPFECMFSKFHFIIPPVCCILWQREQSKKATEMHPHMTAEAQKMLEKLRVSSHL